MPLVSIITVNYNNCAGLQKTVQSVFNQIVTDLEYIIIDGGSNDGSKEYIERYEAKLTYWVSAKDKGTCDAMNKGIGKAKGDYILFLNSGDYLCSDDVLSKISEKLGKEDLIYGNLIFDLDTGLSEWKYPSTLSFKYFIKGSLPHQATFIKRSLFETAGIYREQHGIAFDWEFWLRSLFIYNATYLHIPIAISVYDATGISSKAENLKQQQDERRRVYQELFPLIITDYEQFDSFQRNINNNFFVRVLRKMRLLNEKQ